MRICEAENQEALKEIAKEKELIKNKPYLFNDDRDDYYDNFYWSSLHSSKFEDVTILKTYCQPRPKQNHDGYWFVTGYIEYLIVPTDGGESEVKKLITSSPTAWKE